MSVLRHYTMRAAEGRGGDLRTALGELAAKLLPLPGCAKVELLADPRDPGLHFFVEHWDSIEDHKAAGAALGKQAFGPVLTLLAEPPGGRYLERVLELHRAGAPPLFPLPGREGSGVGG